MLQKRIKKGKDKQRPYSGHAKLGHYFKKNIDLFFFVVW